MVFSFKPLSLSRFQSNHLMKLLIIPGHHLKIDYHLTGLNITTSNYNLQNGKSTKASIYGLLQLSRTSLTAKHHGIPQTTCTTPLTLFRLATLRGKPTNSDTQNQNPMAKHLNGWSKNMNSIPGISWLSLSSNLQHRGSMANMITLPLRNLVLMVSVYGQISCLLSGHGKKR
jgi:hypothetical protein